MRETPLTIVGTVVNDLRPKRVGDDAAMVVNFRMAANERRYDRDSGTWVDGDTLYMTIVCWRRLAENVVACLSKGDPVVVTGKVRTREYEGKDGENRSVTELEASAVGPDLARCGADLRRVRRTGPAGEDPTAVVTAVVTADEVECGDVDDLASTGPLVPAMA